MSLNRTVTSVILFLFIFLTFSNSVYGQTPSSLYSETEFNFEIPSPGPLKYSLGMSNRNILFTYVDGEKVAGSGQEHLELNQFTSYGLSKRSSIALGFRYRFREVFDDEKYDEFRILEEFNYSHHNFPVIKHRLRFEQRFKNVVTEFRLRYRLGISQPLGKEFIIGLSTETLYSMTKNLKPAAEQRLTLKFSNSSVKNLELNAAFQWQYENYNISPENSFYLLTGATLKL